MDATRVSEPTPGENRTTVERKSERELVVTRTFNGPARIVFEAWTKPELFRQWWLPKSMGMILRSCEMDVRAGGTYRLEFEPDGVAFFGTYLEVTPNSRLVWSNDEGGEGGPLTTVTLRNRVARRWWSCTSSIPRRKLSTLPAPGRRMRWSRRSRSWTSFSSPWARAWDGHEVRYCATTDSPPRHTLNASIHGGFPKRGPPVAPITAHSPLSRYLLPVVATGWPAPSSTATPPSASRTPCIPGATSPPGTALRRRPMANRPCRGARPRW